MSKLDMVDVSTHLRDGPYLGVGRYGGKTIYNYRSERFGVCGEQIMRVPGSWFDPKLGR